MQKEDLIQKIISEVVSQLSTEGTGAVVDAVAEESKGSDLTASESVSDDILPDITTEEFVDIYNVKNPENPGAFLNLKRFSDSRIGIGNAGPRYLTKPALRFEADHASAIDAVRHELSSEFVEELGLFEVKTLCESKDDFIQYPEKGRLLDDASVKLLKEKCVKSPQVQIFLADGHTARAIEANAKAILPTLMEGLKAEGISVGTPFFLRFGRVGAEDHVGEILDAEVVCQLIGERPAMLTSESMSAYLAYRPTVGMSESNRTVVSNISRLGTPPAEAGAHLVDLIKTILEQKVTGTELAQTL